MVDSAEACHFLLKTRGLRTHPTLLLGTADTAVARLFWFDAFFNHEQDACVTFNHGQDARVTL